MFEDPKLFRQARTMLGISKREVADAAGEKESSVADIEAERKKFRTDLARRLWAALWKVVRDKKQRFTKEQMEKNVSLLDMMFCADAGLATGISPETLLAWWTGEGKLTPEEDARYLAYTSKEVQATTANDQTTPQAERLTLDQAGEMSPKQVMDAVAVEYQGLSQWDLLNFLLKGKTPTREDLARDIKKYVMADPRVKLSMAREYGRFVEKQRDDLKRELLEAKEELIQTYRRIVALEKELAEERQR